jgi:hypothetical protein
MKLLLLATVIYYISVVIFLTKVNAYLAYAFIAHLVYQIFTKYWTEYLLQKQIEENKNIIKKFTKKGE